MGVIIIAEAGVNHNGDINIAKKLVDVASIAGADYVKFQSFIPNKVVTATAKKAVYQIANTQGLQEDDTQLSMIKALELSFNQQLELIEYCKQKNIKFSSTAFDMESLAFLHNQSLDFIKIPSGEITNLPYLERIGSFNLKVLLSTGMSNLTEIKEAIDVLVSAGTDKNNITVLQCNTQYPTPFEDANILAMKTIADNFQVKIGFSDHTAGIEASLAAVALGATVIEKHFTLDKSLPGPDHKASIEPHELSSLVNGIRNIEKALGSGIKAPTPSEIPNIEIARRSIHIATNIAPGTHLTAEHLIMKRPANGISPMEYHKVIGKKTKIELNLDDQLRWEDLV